MVIIKKLPLNSHAVTKLNICYIYDFNDYSTFVRSWVTPRMLAPLRPIMYLWIQFGASTVACWTLCAFSYTMLSATNSRTHNNKTLHLPWQIPVVWSYWQSKLLLTRSNNERAHLCSGGMTQAHLHLLLEQYQRIWQAGEAYYIVSDTRKELGIFLIRWHPIVFS